MEEILKDYDADADKVNLSKHSIARSKSPTQAEEEVLTDYQNDLF